MTKRSKKHPKNMRNEELAAHVFHPKVLKYAKQHLAKMNVPKTAAKGKQMSHLEDTSTDTTLSKGDNLRRHFLALFGTIR